MHILAIGYGLFLLFALAFVGGLSSELFNASVIIAAIFCISAGIAAWLKASKGVVLVLCCLSAIIYLPIVYKRFFGYEIDIVGFVLDMIFMYLLYGLVKTQPNKSLKERDRASRAAP